MLMILFQIYLLKDSLELELAQLKAEHGQSSEDSSLRVSERPKRNSDGHYFCRQNSELSGVPDDEVSSPQMFASFGRQMSDDDADEDGETSSRRIRFRDANKEDEEPSGDYKQRKTEQNNDENGDSLPLTDDGSKDIEDKKETSRPNWLESELNEWRNYQDGDTPLLSLATTPREEGDIKTDESRDLHHSVNKSEAAAVVQCPIAVKSSDVEPHKDKESVNTSPDGKKRPAWLVSELDEWNNTSALSSPTHCTVHGTKKDTAPSNERASEVARRKLEALNKENSASGMITTGVDEEEVQAYLAKKKHTRQVLNVMK